MILCIYSKIVMFHMYTSYLNDSRILVPVIYRNDNQISPNKHCLTRLEISKLQILL